MEEKIKDSDIDIQLSEKKEVYQVKEKKNMRGKNRKIYRMSDGSERAVFYAASVHELNEENGSYEEPENSITEESGGEYAHGENRLFKVDFNCAKDNGELFEVESRGHKIAVSSVRPKSKKSNDVYGAAGHLLRRINPGKKPQDTVSFEGRHKGETYEYYMENSRLKENIIITEKSESYRYSFNLKMDNLNYEYVEKDKRIYFKDTETNELIFTIPAPYMYDAVGAESENVCYEIKTGENGEIRLSVIADCGWINSEERVFPVTVDPQIDVNQEENIVLYPWKDGTVGSSGTCHVGFDGDTVQRTYIVINKPELSGNPRIKKVWMKLYGYTFFTGNTKPLVALYRVTDSLTVGQCTPENSTDMIDYAHIGGDMEDGKYVYTFDITSVYDIFEKEDISQITLVLKLIDEDITDLYDSYVYLRRTGHIPELIVDYEKNDVFSGSHDSDIFQIGSIGRENIDLLCGNATLTLNDFVWAGNRMPVTLRHMYNSVYAEYDYTANSAADIEEADYSQMKLGKGWKLNIMQSVIESVFQLDGTTYDGYIFLDEYGKKTYLVERSEDRCEGNCENGEYTYEDYNKSGILYEPTCRNLLLGTDVYKFDTSGRLISITDSYGNVMSITYTLGKITSVTDGAGREFEFTYSGDYLSMITAPDGSSISYTYLTGLLIRINYADGNCLRLAYDFDSLIGSLAVADKNGRVVENCTNVYTGKNITEVRSYGSDGNELKLGKVKKYVRSFASNTVTVTERYPADADLCETEDIVSTTVYKYDGDGNQISNYKKESEWSCHNYLSGHDFENLDAWTAEAVNTVDTILIQSRETDNAKYGDYVLRMQTLDKNATANGVYQTVTLPAGTYTASAYLRLMNISGNPSMYIRVTSSDGTTLAESEHLDKKYSDYIRVSEVFTLTQSTSVTVHILMDGRGIAYADAVQLEKGGCAGKYNLIENAGFENGTGGWSKTSAFKTNAGTGTDQSFSCKGKVDTGTSAFIWQYIPAKKSRGTKESFTLSGWAKGYGLTNLERSDCYTPSFRLRAEIKYNDTEYNETGTETYTADFSPQTEEWQFASLQFSKEKYCKIEYICIYCDYEYNNGEIYFDEIKLVRDSIETGLKENDFNLGINIDDIVPKDTEDSEESENIIEDFEEYHDEFGNTVTKTVFSEGEFGTLYSSSVYGNDGNDRIGNRDTRGNTISYNVDADTSKTEKITDRMGNITEYEYDVSGNIIKVVKKNSNNTELANISYEYNEVKNPTEITRGDGMKYAVDYDAFKNLKSIGITGKTEKLITYAYKSGSGRVKSAVYANGDVMKLTYNKLGQVTFEKWYSSDNSIVPTASYEYVYNSEGKLISTIDFKALKEYTYTYGMGNLSKYTQKSFVLDGNVIKARTVDFSIVYEYEDGKLVRTNYISSDGSTRTVSTEYPEKENRLIRFEAGGKTVTSRSKTDGFGRKMFDELQLGTGFVSRQFSYYGGQVTEEHSENEKLKSSPTTALVSQIVYTDGRTISYEYDAEERITKITDTEDGVTEYTYDALGQLLTETKNGIAVNTMTYDEYGNILTKNDIVYTYGNGVWRDLLTGYCGKTISYDAQGNPLMYLGESLSWSKGRQLKAFGNNSYTYNASGVRTSKTVGLTKHSYTLDGTKILKETWGNNTIIPLYSNETDICGIMYNSEPFYFIKNLQGDILSVTDKNGTAVAGYSYDAWGVCTIVSDLSNCNISEVNPFRYRGYYYDSETKLYYLQSRYYDPAIGRFINSDDSIIILTEYIKNIFTYCKNSPLKYIDKLGKKSKVNGIMDFSIGINNTYYVKEKESYYYDSSASPGFSDYFSHAFFNYFVTYDKSVKYIIPNGCAFYEHYLYGNGVPLYFDYLDAYNDDTKIKKFIHQYLNQMVTYASIYCFHPCFNKTLLITGDFSVVNTDTIDWKFALNTHHVCIYAFADMTDFSCAKFEFYIIARDYYQFSEGQSFALLPDSINGRFVEYDWARPFYSKGAIYGEMSVDLMTGWHRSLKLYHRNGDHYVKYIKYI